MFRSSSGTGAGLAARAASAALVLMCLLLALPSARAARLALVIGNDQYQHVGALKNARNDARLMAQTLQAAGFEVVDGVRENLGGKPLWRAIDQFKARIRSGDEVVFYFAGHGVQIGGNPVLLPVDIEAETDEQVEREGVRLYELQDKFRLARFALLVIDACRDNPFPPRPGTRSIGETRGLAPPAEAADGMAVLMAASRGQKALDSVPGVTDQNGLFTHELARALKTPGLDVINALRQVRDRVEDLARRANHAQRPALVDETRGNFYLFAGPAAPPAAAPPVAQSPVPATPSEARPTAGSELRDCADCPTLVVLPTGRFSMGSPDAEVGRDQDEGPLHEVRIDYHLAVGKFELTRGEFRRFVQHTGYRSEAEQGEGCAVWSGSQYERDPARHWASPGFEQTDDHPVVCVSWNDAQAYLQWLNTRVAGAGFRLLSEAEWEYAARAGQGGRPTPWDDAVDTAAQCRHANGMDAAGRAAVAGVSWEAATCSDGHATSAAAQALAPNAYGLHHLHGNVWEWVQDEWHAGYVGAPSDGSVWVGDGDSAQRVLRGGSWFVVPGQLRSAYRSRNAPVGRDHMTGFRIARTL